MAKKINKDPVLREEKPLSFKEKVQKTLFSPGVVICATALFFMTLIVLYALYNQGFTTILTLLSTSLVAMAGAIAYEIISRRQWEEGLAHTIYRMTAIHHRLAEEVANLEERLEKTERSSTSSKNRNIDVIRDHDDLGTVETKKQDDSNEFRSILQAEKESREERADEKTEKVINALRMPKDPNDLMADVLHQAVRQDNLDLFMQPVVTLPNRKIMGYEVFSRITAKKGITIPAAKFIGQAENDNLVHEIDHKVLLHTVALMRDSVKWKNGQNLLFFLNVGVKTFKDQNFTSDIIAYYRDNRRLATRTVFEIAQSDFETICGDKGLRSVVKLFASMGCKFSVDNVKHTNFNIKDFEALNVRYIKISAKTIMKLFHQDEFGFLKIKRELERSGVDLIAEKIETNDILLETLDLHIDFGQGYFFAKPVSRGVVVAAA